MKYTMDDFISKKILVRVGTVHTQEFLKMCEKRGLLWISGDKAAEWTPPDRYGDKTTIGCGGLCRSRLSFGDGTKGCEGWQVIDFKDIIDKPIHNYQIIIDCDGDTTTCKMIINGKEVKAAQAKRNPADKFNWKLGAELAFSRLWGEKKAEKRPVVKAVKRYAKVGEYVKIVKGERNHGETYMDGDILKVSRLFDKDGWVFLENHSNISCGPKEYVVLEGYKPGK